MQQTVLIMPLSGVILAAAFLAIGLFVGYLIGRAMK